MTRLVKLESLRMPFENQISTPWDMYEWADENIENIKFFYVSMEDIASHTLINQNWLTTSETIEVIIVFDQMVKQSLSYIPC